MSMIERVERAIRGKIKVDATGLSPAVASALIVGIEDAARAAIEAMGEPTEEMSETGAKRASGFAGAGNRMCNGYRAMIHAALNEKPEG